MKNINQENILSKNKNIKTLTPERANKNNNKEIYYKNINDKNNNNRIT